MCEERECFLCGKNGNGDPLEEHHIFGGHANRKQSEKYKLKVYLCGIECHRLGKYAQEKCKETDLKLKQYGQRKFMREQNKTAKEFYDIFKKNYLPEEDI